MVVAKQTGWVAPEAHHGWLDLLAQVGWISAALASLGYLVGLVFAVIRWSGRDDGWFSLIYLVVFLCMSLAESVLLSGNNLIWVVFIAALTQLVGPSKPTPPVRRDAGSRLGMSAAPVATG